MNGKIYSITNLVTGKYYIGQTVQPVWRRFSRHKYDSKRGNAHLHLSMRKYGIDNFLVETIMDGIGNQEELNNLEKLWIAITNATIKNYGYNNHAGGNKPPVGLKSTSFSKGHAGFGVGVPRTEEVKRKVSEAQKGENGFWFGKQRSAADKKKIAKKLKGRVFSEETLQRMRLAAQKREERKRNPS